MIHGEFVFSQEQDWDVALDYVGTKHFNTDQDAVNQDRQIVLKWPLYLVLLWALWCLAHIVRCNVMFQAKLVSMNRILCAT